MYKIKNQLGFAHQAVFIVALVVGTVGFVGGNVYQAQQKSKENARQAAVAEEDRKKSELEIKALEEAKKEEAESVSIPVEEKEVEEVAKPTTTTPKTTTTTTEKKTATSSEIRYIPISISSSVGSDNVVLSASINELLTGTCIALVKHSDGSNEQWFSTPLSSTKNCSITIPKSKLTGTTNWKYMMWMKNTALTVKGQSEIDTFSL